jgi:hypothetical protein
MSNTSLFSTIIDHGTVILIGNRIDCVPTSLCARTGFMLEAVTRISRKFERQLRLEFLGIDTALGLT